MTEKDINDALVAKMEAEALAIQGEIFEIAESLFEAYPDLTDEEQTDTVMDVAYRLGNIQANMDTLHNLLKVYLGPILYKVVTNQPLKQAQKRRNELLGE